MKSFYLTRRCLWRELPIIKSNPMKVTVLLNAAAGLRQDQADAEAARVRDLFAGAGRRGRRPARAGPRSPGRAPAPPPPRTPTSWSWAAATGRSAPARPPWPGPASRSACCLSARSTTSPATSGSRRSSRMPCASSPRATAREVDVGEANGRVFVNNSSIGLYPETVRLRDELRRHHGMRKWDGHVARRPRGRSATRPFLRVDLRVPTAT